jgi:hypothetical protein
VYTGALITVLDVLLIVHAARTGRFMPWGVVILFLPGLGALVYIVFELAPAWFGSYGAQRARRSVAAALDPTGRYRALRDDLDLVDTVANRSAVAEECLKLCRPEEALEHYDAILARPLGDEPAFLIGRARALVELGRAGEAVATLEEVRRREPDFHSPDGLLLFARVLEAAGRPRPGGPTRRAARARSAASRTARAPRTTGPLDRRRGRGLAQARAAPHTDERTGMVRPSQATRPLTFSTLAPWVPLPTVQTPP